MKYPTHVCLIAAMLCLAACDLKFHDVRIELVISDTTASALPVYISGNDIALGSWEADKIKMEGGPSLYYVELEAPTSIDLEYKFTRGSWDTEALGEDGKVPPNYMLTVLSDTSVRHAVNQWKTSEYTIEGQVVGERIALDVPGIEGLKARDVWIWLPPDYEISADIDYPVLLMHDGQNVFEPTASLSGQEWRVDETADSMIRAGTLNPFIILAVSNTEDRSAEYSYGSKAELYAQFLIEQLLPYVNERYHLAQGPENTAIMGSSMGGLSSFVLAWEHPEVFGKAACLSPAFKVGEYDYVSKAAKMKRPSPLPAIYIDNGTEDLEARLQAGIDDMKVYLKQENIPFEWYLDQGAKHTEGAWANRLHIPLKWLFGTEN